MEKKILIAGSGNVTGINVIRALKSANINVIGCDYNTANAANKFCKNIVIPACKSEQYLPSILKIIKENNITHIIATNDHDVRSLTENNEELKKVEVKLNAASIHTLDFLDKFKTTSLFLKNGILTPELVYSENDFPYVLRKKRMGSDKKFVHIIKNQKEKEDIKNTEFSSGILTKYIEGPEYTIDALCNESSDVLCAIPRERLIVHNGMVHHARIEKNNNLTEAVKTICKKLNLTGINCIQCIKKDDLYYFIEINPRPGSGIDLSINSGVNMPALWVNNEVSNIPTPNWNLNMIRYYDAYFFE